MKVAGANDKDNVVAMRPVYTDRGNMTEVFYADGRTELDARSLKSVVRSMARRHAVDLREQRKKVSQVLNRQLLLPVVLDKQVFAPFKMRKPLAENDSTYGYVEVSFIDDLMENEKGCHVLLKDGRQIEVLSSREAAVQNYVNGLKLLKEIMAKDKGEHDGLERLAMQTTAAVVSMLSEIYHRVRSLSVSGGGT
ncbi:MAG: hypothetical protein GXX09_04030 [Syntrophomonadaceae bacterium]|nr:hypothetical protein [Syntrophomonadaceae bacterium]